MGKRRTAVTYTSRELPVVSCTSAAMVSNPIYERKPSVVYETINEATTGAPTTSNSLLSHGMPHESMQVNNSPLEIVEEVLPTQAEGNVSKPGAKPFKLATASSKEEKECEEAMKSLADILQPTTHSNVLSENYMTMQVPTGFYPATGDDDDNKYVPLNQPRPTETDQQVFSDLTEGGGQGSRVGVGGRGERGWGAGGGRAGEGGEGEGGEGCSRSTGRGGPMAGGWDIYNSLLLEATDSEYDDVSVTMETLLTSNDKSSNDYSV